MNVVFEWLKWQSVVSGIVIAEEKGRLSWFAAFKRLFSGGVKRNPNGPSPRDLVLWLRVGRTLKRYRCRVCGVYFWGWKKRHICYKFSCFRRRNENTKRRRS